MKINNPKVTLEDEARNGVEEEVRSGFLDWLYEFNVEGDDGELYALGGSILSMNLEKMDLVTICMAKRKGRTRQLPGSILNCYPVYKNVCKNFKKELHNLKKYVNISFAGKDR